MFFSCNEFKINLKCFQTLFFKCIFPSLIDLAEIHLYVMSGVLKMITTAVLHWSQLNIISEGRIILTVLMFSRLFFAYILFFKIAELPEILKS